MNTYSKPVLLAETASKEPVSPEIVTETEATILVIAESGIEATGSLCR